MGRVFHVRPSLTALGQTLTTDAEFPNPLVINGLEITAHSAHPFKLNGVRVNQMPESGLTEATGVGGLYVYIASASGSGGGAGASRALDNSQGSANFTVEAWNTTPGAITALLYTKQFNLQVGLDYVPIPENRIEVEAGQILILGLLVTAPEEVFMEIEAEVEEF